MICLKSLKAGRASCPVVGKIYDKKCLCISPSGLLLSPELSWGRTLRKSVGTIKAAMTRKGLLVCLSSLDIVMIFRIESNSLSTPLLQFSDAL